MKLSKIVMLSILSLLLLSTQCDEDSPALLFCDEFPIVDNSIFENPESDVFTVTSVEIDGNCLLVTISASGCDGSTWVIDLVDSNIVAESSPPQRFLKLVLNNNEACLAVFTGDQSFELSPLRVDGENEIILNIEGFSEPIIYAY